MNHKNRISAIEVTSLKDRHEFLRVLSQHVKVINHDWFYNTEFLSPEHRVVIKDEFLKVVRGRSTIMKFNLDEIKDIGLGHRWLVRTKLKDYRFGIFDYPMNERRKLKSILKLYRTGKVPRKLPPAGENQSIT